jgi:hypothetical protein
MDNTADAASPPSSTSPPSITTATPKISDSSNPFPKSVTVDFDSSAEELEESTVCYCLDVPPRCLVKKKNKTSDQPTDPSPPEQVVSSTDSPPTKKTKPDDEDAPCIYCNYTPCILDQGLYDLLSEGGLLRDDDEDDIKYLKKQIRYDMYRKASHFIYGSLGKGNRKKLPHCVVAEIHDFAPEDDVKKYVGYQETTAAP